jgi:hypothetical protein
MATDRKVFRPLSTLHLLFMLLLSGWWLLLVFEQTPARQLWRDANAHSARGYSSKSMGTALRANFSRASEATKIVAGDLLFGAITIGLFWVGSRVYIRRLEVWLEARGSGEAMSLGGTDLSAETIAANSDTGGILR